MSSRTASQSEGTLSELPSVGTARGASQPSAVAAVSASNGTYRCSTSSSGGGSLLLGTDQNDHEAAQLEGFLHMGVASGEHFLRTPASGAASTTTAIGVMEDLTPMTAECATNSVTSAGIAGSLRRFSSSVKAGADLPGAAGGDGSRAPRSQSPPQRLSLAASQRGSCSAPCGFSRWAPLPSMQCHSSSGAHPILGDKGGGRRNSLDSTAPLSHQPSSARMFSEMRPDVCPLGASPNLSLPSVGIEASSLCGVKGSSSGAKVVIQAANVWRQQPQSHVAGGDTPTSGLFEGFDNGHNDAAELQRRLLADDFSSSPLRKLRRDGIFPCKLMISVLLFFLLLAQVTCFHLPLARANEAMRLAITKRFMYNDTYFTKSDGDIVSAPTAWMENLYNSIEHYVQVYYSLVNTSSSKVSYLYRGGANSTDPCRSGLAHTSSGDHSGERGGAEGGGRSWRKRDVVDSLLWAARARESPSPLRATDMVAGPCAGWTTPTASFAGGGGGMKELPPLYIPASLIAPVLMRVEVDVYSHREGAQHARMQSDPLQSAAPVGRRSRNATTHGKLDGHADGGRTTASADVERHGRRWLTFYVEADRPLGPFAKYREAARQSREAHGRERRRAAEPEKVNPTDPRTAFEGGADGDVPERPGVVGGGSSREMDAVLSAVCMPRYDDLSGRYYRPCVSTRATALQEGTATPIVSEFSLMENVRRITLEVTLRHEVDEVDGLLTVAAGAANGAAFTAETAAGRAERFGAGDPAAPSTPLALRMTSTVYQWHVLKDITVHPGGLVETQLRVNTRVWSTGLSRIFQTSNLMAVILSVLAVLAIAQRRRALQRVWGYNRRLKTERAAILAQQSQHTPPDTPMDDACAARRFPSHDISPQPLFHVRTSPPYEWGIPGSPLCGPSSVPGRGGRVMGPNKATDGTAAPVSPSIFLSGVKAASYGTMRRHGDDCHVSWPGRHSSEAVWSSSSRAGSSSRVIDSQGPGDSSRLRSGCVRQDGATDTSALTVFSVEGAAPLLPTRGGSERGQHRLDTSAGHGVQRPGVLRWLLCGCWGQPLGTSTSSLTGCPPSSSSARTSPLYPRCDGGGDTRAGGVPAPIPRRFPTNPGGTPVSAIASFTSSPSLSQTLLTPQQAERIMERSYVDVHTTWRHYLQESKGVGWHWVAIVAAVMALSYSMLLLAPLLPFIEVPQTNVYYMWTSVLLGVAALLSSVLLLSYLRFFPTLYFPVMASLQVVPQLFIFGVCVLPLFLGFAFFFVIAFGAHSNGHFTTLSWASISLYFMAYGDLLLPTTKVVADTPYAVTSFFAGVLVVIFVLMFFLIMLNMAMSITQHEWLRLRRRFGAALRTSSLLFSVRSRSEVKEEALEAIRTNLEILWYMLGEDEDEERRRQVAAAPSPSSPVSFNVACPGGNGMSSPG
ncbi:hypothetical protein JKF63_06456 [Porcisia hertigi]|uniref:Polycystin cation channel PKD1/PKD2 domain-containing protein n=1 Tax=Porcisia hertigi TaxID=2761500 RepID=A0A836LJZ5_9TRYP|nr:hypothetical protein JKF63_06456 [Porcisia hertigi]